MTATHPIQAEETTGDLPQPHPGRRMTEDQFAAWIARYTRAEWVDGEVNIMSPISFDHSELNTFLLRLLGDFTEHRDLGKVVGPEYMVRLPGQRQRRMPDVLFVAKAHHDRFKRMVLDGPPDLVIEIVSPDSVARDYRDKFNAYQAAGVPEYWIIDPLARAVEAHALSNNTYQPIPQTEGKIPSTLLPGLFLKPAWLFPETGPLPKVRTILAELGIP